MPRNLRRAIELLTTNPDTEPPEIDINQHSRSDAEPTNPERSQRRDESDRGSAVQGQHLRSLRGVHGSAGPAGRHARHGHIYLHYLEGEEGERGIYPGSDPSQWKFVERVVILPPGSIPGTWGIAEITVQDRARNLEKYNFVEIIHFDVDGG